MQLEKDTYFPGEIIKGRLLLDVPKPVKARRVELAFVGKEHAKVVRGSGKNRHVYIEERVIVATAVDVWVASPGGELGPCNEVFPFEFQIPGQALPSMVVKNNLEDTISYEIKAKIDRPHAFDVNANVAIQVIPIPIETYPAMAVVESFQDPRGRDYIEVSIDKNVFIPGEQVSGRVKFKKDPMMKARAVECAMLFTESATAQDHTDTYPVILGNFREELDPSAEYYEWPFNFQTPQSWDFTLEGILIRRIWMVDVKVDLPLKKDQHVIVPLLFLPLRRPVTPA